MNILVCLKMVSQSTYTDTLSEAAGAERLSGTQLVMNPADSCALEAALKIKDKNPGTVVTVITMSPKTAEPMLRTALGMGADKAVLVSDYAFAGADTIATSAVLAGAIRLLPPQDIILCGKKAIDSETGHIGSQLAELLEMPCLSGVLEFSVEDGAVNAQAATGQGIADYGCMVPAVLTVINGTGMVRQPTIFGMRRANKAAIELVSSSRVAAAASGTETISVREVSFTRRNGITILNADEGAEGLVRLL